MIKIELVKFEAQDVITVSGVVAHEHAFTQWKFHDHDGKPGNECLVGACECGAENHRVPEYS